MKKVHLACSGAFDVQLDRDSSGFDQSCVAIRADLLMIWAAIKATAIWANKNYFIQ